jgi:hypothetical protein
MRTFLRWLTVLLFVLAALPASAQTGGAVLITASDPSTGGPVAKVGDATNNAIRIRIVASDISSSGGTSIADNAVFTQSTTAETPMSGLFITSYTAATSGHSTIQRMTSGGASYENLDAIGNNAVLTGNGTTGTGSLRVTIASDNTAFSVNSVQSGTWTVNPGNTPNTTQWLVKSGPFDACGTTTYDPAPVLIADTTLDVLTGTTTCVDTVVVANVGSTQETITVQDTQGTPVQLLKVVPVAPGASMVVSGLGGVKFASGIKYQASTANKLSIWVKGRQ